eukprot:jgi/Mesvir1/8800/Mv02704-RA.1
MAEKLLDFSLPFDVPLLDATVTSFYGAGSNEQRIAAESVLRQLQEHPDAWTKVDGIIEKSTSVNTKYFALQILENLVKYRWNMLPMEQRDGIKNYVSNLIIKISTDEATFRSEHTFLNKLNVILVQVLKHEWPGRWQSFIPDLVNASRSSETLCENCMVILKLLSEEVFDFSRGEMTQAKTKDLKTSLNSSFSMVHELCEFVLARSTRPALVKATLNTLHAFLSWIPLAFIFERNMVETLLKLFPNPMFRNVALQCLTEIGSLSVGAYYDAQFVTLYSVLITQLQAILPAGTDLATAYAEGSDEEQSFLQNLALFFTGFFKVHVNLLEASPEHHQALQVGLEYLLAISYIDDSEVFKVCLDFWNWLVSDLFSSECTSTGDVPGITFPNFAAPPAVTTPVPGAPPGMQSQRKFLYANPMSRLRLLMISRMAKPEEVLVVEDENGNIVREAMKDIDVQVQYRIMRETLIFLSHLDQDDTESQMLDKLALQLSGTEFTWSNLSTLCWAIGSIAGTMPEDQENRFLVTVIRDLLNLCEITRGKDHKAVIASNIMYVVGQYPRFLRAHWKFLKTVVNKLFEFMHETHPGVQDMACDTFLKISEKCRKKFVVLQVSEMEPFICELLHNLPLVVVDLQPHQKHTFYEAAACMIAAEAVPTKRDEYLTRLMEPPNQSWLQIIASARENLEYLKAPNVIREVANILQTNVSVCSSLGQAFVPQISLIFLDMLNFYRMYSELISVTIAKGDKNASRTTEVKLMRSVKRQVLRLIETFVGKTEDVETVARQFVPPMMDPILGDYARNVPDARDAEVLSLFACIINQLKGAMMDDVIKIFESVFECTLQMITKNFEDYPEHRLKFFSLLRAITNHCFRSLIMLSPPQLKLVMDSIVWAIRHTERNVAETGLNLLLELLNSFQTSEFANQFHQSYFLMINQEIFAVLADTFHKPGFKLHALILQHLFNLVDAGGPMGMPTVPGAPGIPLGPSLTLPLWDVATLGANAYPSNAAFVRDSTVKLLTTSFTNLNQAQVELFVSGLFELKGDLPAFKNHLRDFLVQTKEFSAQDNAELYSEEAERQKELQRQRMMQIPGMIAPATLQDDMDS